MVASAASDEVITSFDDTAAGIEWTVGSCAPGEVPTSWSRISGPMTVAAAWRELGRLDLEDPATAERLDGNDHWLRGMVPAEVEADRPRGGDDRRTMLEFDGLATIVEVWLNGTLQTTSTSMFVPVAIDVTPSWRVDAPNAIELRCRSLTAWLDAATWPRPRWRTRLVEEQRLRNVRTTLLGRIPTWSPPVPPVGPFREGRLRIGAGTAARRDRRPAGADRWTPWTHGTPTRTSGAPTVAIDHGADGDEFHVVVNGERVFCRGAVWMPIDPVSLRSSAADVRRRLELAISAGFNMLRLSGTTVYEEPHFYELCDELGIMVWQDVMLANMDVPTDEAYLALLRAEIDANMPTGPSLTIVCGSSETEQQATMMGHGADVVGGFPMRTHLPAWVADAVPGVPYLASTPSGGHLPFTVDTGVGHYFGVGAYLRPLSDARHARVTFAAESLAFANVPCPGVVRRHLREGQTAPTHPRWKARVPRDRGVGWDFEDVRDHYVHLLFGVDARRVAYGDPARYLALGRAASAEVIARTFAEFRRSDRCGGAIVWTFSDLWRGAGWGLVDSDGFPKSPLGPLQDVLAPVGLFAVDEGVNGLDFWIANDTATVFDGVIDLRQYRHGSVVVAEASSPVRVAPRSMKRLRADQVLGRFSDPTYAYRFGPRAHDATAAVLRCGTELVARALHTPDGADVTPVDAGLSVTAGWRGDSLLVEVTTSRLARYVTVEAGQTTQSHDHTHVEPGRPLAVTLGYGPDTVIPRRGFISALNNLDEVGFAIPARPEKPA